MGANELDIVAVQQDAASVHALATRALDEVDMHDPAVALLAAWVAEIDSGFDETARFVMPRTSSSRPTSLASSSARGRRTTLIAGSTVLALVVSAGAAAAVTGDPLALVRAPLHAMAKVNPFVGDESNAREQLPKQTPDRAKANKLLADARRAMAAGDAAKAQTLLTEAAALLGGTANPGLQHRIDKLASELPGQSGTEPKGKNPVGQSGTEPKGGANQDPQGSNDQQGSNDPQGKGSADKSTTKPSPGTSTGGSSKPRKGDPSGTAADSPSTKPTQTPKASPKG